MTEPVQVMSSSTESNISHTNTVLLTILLAFIVLIRAARALAKSKAMADKNKAQVYTAVAVEGTEMNIEGAKAKDEGEVYAGVISPTGSTLFMASKMNIKGGEAEGRGFVMTGCYMQQTMEGARKQTEEQRERRDAKKAAESKK